MTRWIGGILLGFAMWGCSAESVALTDVALMSGDIVFGELRACCPPEGGEREVGMLEFQPRESIDFGVDLSSHGLTIVDVSGPVRFEIRTGGPGFEPFRDGTAYPLPATLRVVATGCGPARFRVAVGAVAGDPADGRLVEGTVDVPVQLTPGCGVPRGPRVAMDGSGNGMIVYEDAGSIAAESYRAGAGFQTPVSVDQGARRSAPDIAMDGAGNAVAVWLREINATFGVFAAVYSHDTGVWSEPVELEPASGTAQPVAPRVVLARDGSGFAVWARDGKIKGRRIEALAFLEQELSFEGGTSAYGRPRAAINNAGDLAVIVWESTLGGAVGSVRRATWTRDGGLGPDELVADLGAAEPDVALAGPFGAIVYSSDTGVYVRRLVESEWIAPERLWAGPARTPQVAIDESGAVRACWDAGDGGIRFDGLTVDAFDQGWRFIPSGFAPTIAVSNEATYLLAPSEGTGTMIGARLGRRGWVGPNGIDFSDVDGPGIDAAADETDTCIAVWIARGQLKRYVWGPPTPAFTAGPAVVGQPVTFDATASEGFTDIASFVWDFRDSADAFGSGATVEHTFFGEGVFRVQLTVADYWGNRATVERDVDVATSSGDTVTLTIRFSGGGSGQVFLANPSTTCTQTCTIQIPRGTFVFLQPFADAGSSFSRWTGCDQDAGVEGCGVTMNADRTVDVFFE